MKTDVVAHIPQTPDSDDNAKRKRAEEERVKVFMVEWRKRKKETREDT